MTDSNHLKAADSAENKTQDTAKSPQALREEKILAFWDEHKIFHKTLAKESPKGDFVFYDGPPYATGLPHVGHMIPSTVKDLIPRFKTMQGYHVSRRWGWDCHGLPIENLIEKELNLPDKKAIIDFGIDKFNKAARDSVFRYDAEWKKVIHRVGRFVDMENAYHTMDPAYTESVWWSFKTLHNKGLVYEGFKAMQVCPRCETTLSNFEINQGYKDVQDISVYALFELADEKGSYMLAWTTTPWTLHGNVALAVNPDLEYVKVKTVRPGTTDEIMVILAEARASVLKDSFEIVEKYSGKDLAGKKYIPVFDTYAKDRAIFPIRDHENRKDNAWKIYTADFVTAEDGTGIVHIAPGFGDDDYKLGEANQLPLIQHIYMNGQARPELGEPFAGKPVKTKADPQGYDIEIIKALAHSGKLFAKEKITHSYAHCWRCDTPLLNFATSAWFVEVTKLQNRFIEENNSVKWIPEAVGSGRFGTWLENLRDWNLSRARFWGAPLPVWRGVDTGKIEVIGSVEELKSHIPKRNSFTLMRHGEAECNITSLICSRDTEICPLTEKGREQVLESAQKLKNERKITKIYASDFRRTRETAEAVAEVLGIDKSAIVLDKRLRECNAGEFDGGKWKYYWGSFESQQAKMYERKPEAESIFDVKRRTTEFLYEIDAAQEGEDVLVVTHGLPLKMMEGTSIGRTARDFIRIGWSDNPAPNASLHEIDWRALPHNESLELDIHRPYVDAINWTHSETGEKMVRVNDVFDVWYDSGAMPFAQNHFPFEQIDRSKVNNIFDVKELPTPPMFPANFIAEGLDQTRGWFYSLLALGVGLFDKIPYQQVIVNGLMLAEDGRKMSKSLKNYPDIWITMDKYGVDALRFFLASSPATHGEEVLFSEKSFDEINKKIFNRIDNVYAFLDMYADTEPVTTDLLDVDQLKSWLGKVSHPLDLWIIARMNETIGLVTKNLEAYVIDKATRPIGDFIDDLSVWYVRRSRDRFKSDDLEDRKAAIFTTRLVLERLSRIIAPVAPFAAEILFKKVHFADILSVHLDAWPLPIEIETGNIIEDMRAVRAIVEKGLALRAEAKIKARQPLALFTYTTESIGKEGDRLNTALENIIQDELNVKEVKLAETLMLDTNITDELRHEGAVRDVIRAIQQERKNKNMNPQDTINLVFGASAAAHDIIKNYAETIQNAVSATLITFSKFEEVEAGVPVEFLDETISFLIGA